MTLIVIVCIIYISSIRFEFIEFFNTTIWDDTKISNLNIFQSL